MQSLYQPGLQASGTVGSLSDPETWPPQLPPLGCPCTRKFLPIPGAIFHLTLYHVHQALEDSLCLLLQPCPGDHNWPKTCHLDSNPTWTSGP